MLKRAVRHGLERLGYEIRRTVPPQPLISARIRAFMHFTGSANVKTIVDVGANAGQFGEEVFSAGWHGDMLSFEPLSDAYSMLTSRADRQSGWHVAERMALGSEATSTIINVAGNSQSSSLLPMLDLHVQSAPESAYVGQESVVVRRLDTELLKYPVPSPFALKMDCQGYESEVIQGAAGVLPDVRVIILEMATQPLYAGEKLFHEIAGDLRQLGFRCAGIFNGHTDPSTHEVFQCDGIFIADKA